MLHLTQKLLQQFPSSRPTMILEFGLIVVMLAKNAAGSMGPPPPEILRPTERSFLTTLWLSKIDKIRIDKVIIYSQRNVC